MFAGQKEAALELLNIMQHQLEIEPNYDLADLHEFRVHLADAAKGADTISKRSVRQQKALAEARALAGEGLRVELEEEKLESQARVGHTSHVTRDTSHITRCTAHVTSHTPHASYVTRHTSHVIRHTSSDCVP